MADTMREEHTFRGEALADTVKEECISRGILADTVREKHTSRGGALADTVREEHTFRGALADRMGHRRFSSRLGNQSSPEPGRVWSLVLWYRASQRGFTSQVGCGKPWWGKGSFGEPGSQYCHW